MPAPAPGEGLVEGSRFRALRTGLEDPRFVLEGIGALLVKESGRAFQEERMGKVRWKNREETGMVPNWPAILGHFAEKSSAPPMRMFERGNTLQGTGFSGGLIGSFNWQVLNQDTVEAGTKKTYAGVLHSGGTSETVTITEALQDRMWKWMQKVRGQAKRGPANVAKAAKRGPEAQARSQKSADRAQRQADLSRRLGWLLNQNLRGQKLKVKHPPRPMVGLPDSLIGEIQAIYGLRVRRA